MSAYRQQAQLDVPIEDVWHLVGDVRQHPKWWPRVMDVHCEGIDEGCEYRQVTKQPMAGAVETTVLIESLDECRQILVRCIDTGTYARWLLTEARGGTFIDVEFGMNPMDLRQRVFDVAAGKRYFRRWLEKSIDALRVASEESRAPATEARPRSAAPRRSRAPGG
jgi:hypothetical protein